jgi:hypothetical protein
MNSVGDAFSYPFRSPGWFGKIVLQSLIAFIPIVGWIAMTGWLMLTFENVRAGRMELPPAGFHLSRGIGIFGVFLIYGIVLNIPAFILFSLGGGFNFGAHNNYGYYYSSPVGNLGSTLSFVAGLFLDFLVPSLIVNTYHFGFAGGLDVQRVWRYATTNVTNGVIAGAIIFVASLIGAAGVIACCIGLLFTIGYQNAIQAGVAAWFERMQAAPAAPGAPAA